MGIKPVAPPKYTKAPWFPTWVPPLPPLNTRYDMESGGVVINLQSSRCLVLIYISKSTPDNEKNREGLLKKKKNLFQFVLSDEEFLSFPMKPETELVIFFF